MPDPDIVFPVRPGERNEELRYALRSLRFLPHGRVWIAGHRPSWVKGVEYIKTYQRGNKHVNALNNLLLAAQQDGVAESFVLWNDDMYLLEPIDQVPVKHRGTIADYLAAKRHQGVSSYVRGVRETGRILNHLGFADPLCYELHIPMPMRKRTLMEAFRIGTAAGVPGTRVLQMRTLYGNLAGIGGEYAEDVKVFTKVGSYEQGELPFLSTSDGSWGRHPVTQDLMKLLSEPGPYEVV